MSNYLNAEMETSQSSTYDSVYWSAKVAYSNRFGNSIRFANGLSDRTFNCPETRVASTIARLVAGEDPDAIAKSFSIEFN
jgi:hypothetical protein